MAAQGPKDEIAWDLDWDDLTEGSPAASPIPLALPVAEAPAASPPQNAAANNAPPPLPQKRAFPTPATLLPDEEDAGIVPPQRLPSANRPSPVPTPVAAPPPLPTFVPVAPSAVNPPSSPPVPAAAGPAAAVRLLVRGQRLRLTEVLSGDPPPAFAVGLEITAPSGVTIDRCCFGLDENGKLSDDRYFVFYNQKESPDGAISMRGAWREIFHVDLARLPSTIRRLVFTATVDGAGTLRKLGASRFELHPMGGTGGARYEFSGNDLDDVKALMVAEIYYKDGWRLAAVGQGFAGGLGDVLKHFGGQEI